jgi:phospholipid/cholesterol/gamma-HCH transport system permease protein
MFILRANLLHFLERIKSIFRLLLAAVVSINFARMNRKNLIEQMISVGPQSLGVSVVTAGFIGAVFTLQIVKEFLYLDASSFIGAIISIAFIRELSPVFTAIIISSRIGSSFTAELASMKVTEQIDSLYLLKVDPIAHLVLPRLIACIAMLPFLNLFFLLTSLFGGLFTSFVFYSIHPWTFLNSSFSALSCEDFIKSSFKSMIFGLILSSVSCVCGLNANGGSKNVGRATTSAVVIALLLIFIFDCILTYILFNQSDSTLKFL